MKIFKTHFKIIFLALMTSWLGLGCSQLANLENASLSTSARKCVPPQGVSGRPNTIDDVVTLVNSLPKPVTVGCFLESLDRPLNVTLSNSQISVQPASGSRSPRVFILNDKLYMSVVPEGRGQDFLEISYQTSTTTSIKAEIEFPVLEAISKSKPYANIISSSGTNCRSCHRAEKQVATIEDIPLIESWAFQPDKETLVDLQNFKNELSICNFEKEPDRCEIIRAILSNGEVKTQAFPQDMYYNFSMW